MSTPEQTSPMTPKKSSFSGTIVFVTLLFALAGGYYLYVKSQYSESIPTDDFHSLKPFFARLGQNQQLAEGYVDANKDLVADAPSDVTKFFKVEEIGFSVVGTDDEQRVKAEQADWKDLMLALEKNTGKKVKYLTDLSSPAVQMESLKAGRLHVTAFNTGAVPSAVNSSAFVPLFSPADANANYSYQMQILVKPNSPIQKPEDLKGKTIGFVALSSNSGARAPIYTLKEKFSLLPGRDYTYKILGDHYTSIGEIVYGNDVDAVCVASDLKDRAVALGKIRYRLADKELKADQFRVLYTSDSFPPLVFGVSAYLPPDIRAAVEKTFKEFSFSSSSAKRYADQGKTKFAAVNYEKDWKYVREIDAALSKFAELP